MGLLANGERVPLRIAGLSAGISAVTDRRARFAVPFARRPGEEEVETSADAIRAGRRGRHRRRREDAARNEAFFL
ncbi:MAG: hypothetical protein R3F55_04880 [Alphaproteobacteria bacterium]